MTPTPEQRANDALYKRGAAYNIPAELAAILGPDIAEQIRDTEAAACAREYIDRLEAVQRARDEGRVEGVIAACVGVIDIVDRLRTENMGAKGLAFLVSVKVLVQSTIEAAKRNFPGDPSWIEEAVRSAYAGERARRDHDAS